MYSNLIKYTVALVLCVNLSIFGQDKVLGQQTAPLISIQEDAGLELRLWPNGQIFWDLSEDAMAWYHPEFVRNLKQAMRLWEEHTQGAVEFIRCGQGYLPCPTKRNGSGDMRDLRILIQSGQGKNHDFCSYGANIDTEVAIKPIAFWGSPNPELPRIVHELGHGIGLWHEQNRIDAPAWLKLKADVWSATESECDSAADANYGQQSTRYQDDDRGWCGITMEEDVPGYEYPVHLNPKKQTLYPLLGNYDYDSAMHYGSGDNWTDFFYNKFNNRENEMSGIPSPRDCSRVLQYYAREVHPGWGYFRHLSHEGGVASMDRPYPYLAPNVKPMGTPAIAFQNEDDFDIFVRGSDQRIYWRKTRDSVPYEWMSLGCCFTSDPAAISFADGRVDVFAVGAETGRLLQRRYSASDDHWSNWIYLSQEQINNGGIKQSTVGVYIGPAVASRGDGMLDVFLVLEDGRIASSSYKDSAWSDWRTHGNGYSVVAQPSAVATDDGRVVVALHLTGGELHETYLLRNVSGKGLVSFKFDPNARGKTLTYSKLAPGTPAALAKRDNPDRPYRVLIVNEHGRLSHRIASKPNFETGPLSVGGWRDIGGIPLLGSGPAVVATGRFSVRIIMNGEDATGSDWHNSSASNVPRKEFIQPGGLWSRAFR